MGRVKSLSRKIIRGRGGAYFPKEKFMQLRKNKQGYIKTFLTKNSSSKLCAVHRLVSNAFIPNTENKPQVNHKNGIKADNYVENLEWVTGSENCKHAFRIGLECNKGEKNPIAKLTEINVIEIRNEYSAGNTSHSLLAIKYKVTSRLIWAILNRRAWTHI
jgi:hypothetical protein